MLINKIIKNAEEDSNKIALIYDGLQLNYHQLLATIQERVKVLELYDKSTPIFLDSASELQNLLNHLAANVLGIPSVFSSKNLLEEQKEALKKEHNLRTFSYENSIFQSFISLNGNIVERKKTAYFLGVLTSGSTGVPTLIWKDNEAWERAFSHQSSVFKVTTNDTVFVLDAMGYSANLNAALHTLWLGGTLMLGKLAKASFWFEEMKKYSVSSIFLVPSHLKLISEEIQQLQNLRSVVTAGEKLASKIAKQVVEKLPTICLTEYYGTAELGHISYQQNEEIWQYPFSVGKAFPEVDISIKENKIYVESPYVSPEYRSIKTVSDLGLFEEGRLVLLGRAGRMFNKRGLNVFAEEIESVALEPNYIKEAALIAVRRLDNSTRLVLFYVKNNCISLENGRSVHQLLKHYLNQKLIPAKRPNYYREIEFLPRLENGKINFQALKNTFASSTKEEMIN